jgi:cytochrome c5
LLQSWNPIVNTGGGMVKHSKIVQSLAVLAVAAIVQGCEKQAPAPIPKAATPPPAARSDQAAPAPAASGAAAPATGEDSYRKACASCHDQGVAGAPRLGDKAAWEPRIKQGLDALYTVGLKGKPGTAMMPKGGNPSLSDADVKAAVDHMVTKARYVSPGR